MTISQVFAVMAIVFAIQCLATGGSKFHGIMSSFALVCMAVAAWTGR